MSRHNLNGIQAGFAESESDSLTECTFYSIWILIHYVSESRFLNQISP